MRKSVVPQHNKIVLVLLPCTTILLVILPIVLLLLPPRSRSVRGRESNMAVVGLYVGSWPCAITPRPAAAPSPTTKAFFLPEVLSLTDNTFLEVHQHNKVFGGRTTLIDY